ncbi:MAG TPA: hypothetical protein VFD84_06260 [Candidatus Binatia bacterium]|nr:hypothetical protein [Candidatus Binatia bacterium]
MAGKKTSTKRSRPSGKKPIEQYEHLDKQRVNNPPLRAVGDEERRGHAEDTLFGWIANRTETAARIHRAFEKRRIPIGRAMTVRRRRTLVTRPSSM